MENDFVKIDKLQGIDGWITWKFQIVQILESLELYDVVTGIDLPPKKDDADKYTERMQAWRKTDAKARRYISTACGKQPVLHILNCKSSNEMWNALKKVYEPNSSANIFLLQQRYMLFTKDPGDDIATFFSKLLDIVQQLKERDELLSESMIMTKIQMALPSEYNYFHSAWDSVPNADRTLENMKSRLLTEESRMKAQGSVDTVEALVIKKGYSKSKKIIRRKKTDRNGGCFKCGSPEHWQKDCNKSNNVVPKSKIQHGDALMCESGNSQSNSELWWLDSGATHHMSNQRKWFTSFVESSSSVKIGDGKFLRSDGHGDINIAAFDGEKWCKKHLANVLYVPTLHTNLFSSGAVTLRNMVVIEDKEGCRILNKGSVVAVGVKQGRMNRMLFKVVSIDESVEANVTSTSNKLSIRIWHERFGHQNLAHVRKFLQKNNTHFIDEDYICEACVQGKQHRLSFENRNEKAIRCGEIIHSDVCTMPIESFGGAKYFLLFRDDFSKYRYVYPIKNKSDVFDKFKTFVALMNNDCVHLLKIFRSDNGLEFVNDKMKRFMEERGIRHQRTVPYTPEQNGCAERDNRTLVEAVRTMLISNDLDKRFWAEAINTFVYVINRTGKSTIEDKTPFELWTGKKANIENLRAFGCEVFVHVPKEKRNKIDSKSVKCIFVGYDENVKGFRVWNPNNEKVEMVRDVIFSNNDNEKVLLKIDDQCENVFSDLVTRSVEKELINEVDNSQLINETVNESVEVSTPKGSLCDFNVANIQECRFRDRNAHKNKHSCCTVVEQVAMLALVIEPDTYEEAIQASDCEQWIRAMDDEYESLNKNQTWILVKNNDDKKVIDNRWVFKIKYKSDGFIERYKARLVARGFTQEYGVDYQETFSPVVKFTSIRAILTVVAARKLRMKQFDVKTAFLYGDLDETVFMRQPIGYDDGSGRVCKLLKSLYGLKQASRCWNKKFTDFILRFNFKICESDPCVFVRSCNSSEMILAIYIDDGLIAAENEDDINTVISSLQQDFDIKVMNIDCFLGIHVNSEPDGSISINQHSYANKVLHRFNMFDCNPVSTPSDTSRNLGEGDSTRSVVFPYRKAIGSLMYLAICTRPDICFAVNNASRHMENPSNIHVNAVKRILKYIKGTINAGIIYRGDETLKLCGYSDADYAGDIKTRRSTSGYAFFVGSGIVSWCSERQKSVSLSTTESEYIAASQAVKEMIWLKRLMSELIPNKLCTPVLFMDNQSAIRLIKNPEFHKRTKHIDIRYHFIREKFESGDFELEYVSTDKQAADIFTKSLAKVKHKLFCNMLGLQPI